MRQVTTLDLTGMRFGRLTVLTRADDVQFTTGSARPVWTCVCDCGEVKNIQAAKLRSGHTKSCGCLSQEISRKMFTQHGMSRTPIYVIWVAMIQRCRSKDSAAYKNYGARGITVCDRWMNFSNFYSDMGDKPLGKSIERINNSLGYSPENCKWASSKEQCRNKRNNRVFNVYGEEKCLSQIAEEYGFRPDQISNRLRKGWSIFEAISIPIGERKEAWLSRKK